MRRSNEIPSWAATLGSASELSAFLTSEDMPQDRQLAVLKLVIDSVPDAIVVHDVIGHVLFVNERACALLGYTREEFAALDAFGWVSPEYLRTGGGRAERILDYGQLGFESAARRKDGTDVPTDVVARRVEVEGSTLIVSAIRDIRDRVEARNHLEYLAYHDALTGLSNRTAFEERLRVAIADTRRHGDILGLAYIDLDRFKPINDHYGHHAGDAVLVTLGGRLVTSVREQDMVARLGGDEFVILLPRMTSVDEFAQLAERLMTAIEQPIEVEGATCDITAAVGFALFDHAHDDARTLLVKADIAMYRAKQNPTHRWLEWQPEMGMAVNP